MLTCIDCFTKFAWGKPLKSTKCEEVAQAVENILSSTSPPKKINSDRGNEFKCARFKKLLCMHKIHHYLTYSSRKAAIVEQFNLTIEMILYKILSHERSLEWVCHMDKAFKIYNRR